MGKRLTVWEWMGFGAVCALGVVLHFAYEWSGENAVMAISSAVNESTWEHMKLFFVSYVLFSAVEFFAIGREYPNFLVAKALGAHVGLAVIPVVFYTVRGAVGTTADWFNISIFFLSAALAQLVSWRTMGRRKPYSPFFQIGGFLLLWGLAVLFLLFTYAPPHIPLFMDPLTMQYGR